MGATFQIPEEFVLVPCYETTDEVLLASLWPRYSVDAVEGAIFDLTYCQHGGSGLNWTRADVLEMTWDNVQAAMERLHKRRKAEAQAIRAAQRAPKGTFK